MLYGFLLSDKYDMELNVGMLSYLNDNGSQMISTSPEDRNALIQGRNLLSGYIVNGDLPPILQNTSVCSRCYMSDSCMVLHKVIIIITLGDR